MNQPVKILQFGKGNFLRAFTGWMTDVLNERTAFNGAIQIVQVNSAETDDRFDVQEGLYHIVINGISNAKPFRHIRLIKCVTGVINPRAQYNAFLKTAENPDLQFIVSNTTEAGLKFEPSDKIFGECQNSFPGKLAAWLYHRYRFFGGDPLRTVTVLPCELIEHNGKVLRDLIQQYIAHWQLEDGFAKWITDHTLFCNTLVDRIVPGFPRDEINKIWDDTGFEDYLVVAAEPYHLWVIEPMGFPGFTIDKLRAALPLDRADLNVRFVSDLAGYRTRKVRILNGAHTCMVSIGYLRGLRTVKEAVEDTFTGDFISKAIHEEIIPTLDMPEKELKQFAQDVMERFQNPYIRHELKSIALNSVSKFQVRVLPTMLDYFQRTNRVPQRLSYALACLIVFYKGQWKGEPLPVNDTPEVVNFFGSAWENADAGRVTQMVLSNADLWKQDLTKLQGWGHTVRTHLQEILENE